MATDGPMARRVADLRLGLTVLNGRARARSSLGRRAARRCRLGAGRRRGARHRRPGAIAAGVVRRRHSPRGCGARGRGMEGRRGDAARVWMRISEVVDRDDAARPRRHGAAARRRDDAQAVGLHRGAHGTWTRPVARHAFVERHRLPAGVERVLRRSPGGRRPDVVRRAVRARRRHRPGDGHGRDARPGCAFITPGNLLGIPVVSRCRPASADGLPIGVQVYADLWRDLLALTAAEVDRRRPRRDDHRSTPSRRSPRSVVPTTHFWRSRRYQNGVWDAGACLADREQDLVRKRTVGSRPGDDAATTPAEDAAGVRARSANHGNVRDGVRAIAEALSLTAERARVVQPLVGDGAPRRRLAGVTVARRRTRRRADRGRRRDAAVVHGRCRRRS